MAVEQIENPDSGRPTWEEASAEVDVARDVLSLLAHKYAQFPSPQRRLSVDLATQKLNARIQEMITTLANLERATMTERKIMAIYAISDDHTKRAAAFNRILGDTVFLYHDEDKLPEGGQKSLSDAVDIIRESEDPTEDLDEVENFFQTMLGEYNSIVAQETEIFLDHIEVGLKARFIAASETAGRHGLDVAKTAGGVLIALWLKEKFTKK